MDDSKHLDNAVGRYSVDDKVARRSDAARRRDPQSHKPNRVGPHATETGDAAGAGQKRSIAERGHGSQDQEAVSTCRLDALRSGAFKKNGVDRVLGRPREAVRQLFVGSQAGSQPRHPALMKALSILRSVRHQSETTLLDVHNSSSDYLGEFVFFRPSLLDQAAHCLFQKRGHTPGAARGDLPVDRVLKLVGKLNGAHGTSKSPV